MSDVSVGDTAIGTLRRMPVVAIVGRPNVGKSALFNRLVGARKAIVEDIPGTTRDRLYGEARWDRHACTIIDTGGLDLFADGDYAGPIREHVRTAVAEADVILFLVDVVEGITATDLDIADLLRRSDKPVILVANKSDNEIRAEAAVQFFELGLGDPFAISAYHGRGMDPLLDQISGLLPPPMEQEALSESLGIAIIGRPNVGKSSLLNVILGEERVIVSEMPGTTRDAIDTPLDYKDKHLVFVDTAGIRRPGLVQKGIEKHSVLRAREAIERSDVVILVIDSTAGVTAQDTHIAGQAADAHKGLIVTVNKWDLMEDSGEDSRKNFASWARRRLRFLPWAPLCFVSALTRLNIDDLLELAIQIGDTRAKRVTTHDFNLAIQKAIAAHPLPIKGTRWPKILYATQAEVRPPTFVFFVNDASLIHFSYRRYLEKAIRSEFGYEGTAIRLIFRNRSDR